MRGIPFQTIHFIEEKKHPKLCNFVQNYSVEDKNAGIPFRTIPQKRITLGILFYTANEKTSGNLFRTVQEQRKTLR
jgi:hypothetical protein